MMVSTSATKVLIIAPLHDLCQALLQIMTYPSLAINFAEDLAVLQKTEELNLAQPSEIGNIGTQQHGNCCVKGKRNKTAF